MKGASITAVVGTLTFILFQFTKVALAKDWPCSIIFTEQQDGTQCVFLTKDEEQCLGAAGIFKDLVKCVTYSKKGCTHYLSECTDPSSSFDFWCDHYNGKMFRYNEITEPATCIRKCHAYSSHFLLKP